MVVDCCVLMLFACCFESGVVCCVLFLVCCLLFVVRVDGLCIWCIVCRAFCVVGCLLIVV